MDLSIFCRHFYASRFLPIALMEQGQAVLSLGLPEGVRVAPSVIQQMVNQKRNPAVLSAPDGGLYGLVDVPAQQAQLVIGPAYSGVSSEERLHAFMTLSMVEHSRADEVEPALSAIPHYSYNRFLNTLAFLHFVLNGEEVSVTEHFAVSDLQKGQEIASHHAQESYTQRDEQQSHGTYFFEQRMLDFVKAGNVEGLRAFLLQTVQREPLMEGKLADTPLRQAKNLLIGTTTLVGKNGAIPGGMDIEEAYQLIDIYIQECERAQSVDVIKNLQFNMLLDFTARVAQAQRPEGLSPEVFACTQFVASRVNEPISLNDVAAHIGKSRAWITAKFRQETGLSIAEFISQCRMREAKSLLKNTDKSLLEISAYLCYSSQAYFASVFKKQYGLTPTEYRQRHFMKMEATEK